MQWAAHVVGAGRSAATPAGLTQHRDRLVHWTHSLIASSATVMMITFPCHYKDLALITYLYRYLIDTGSTLIKIKDSNTAFACC